MATSSFIITDEGTGAQYTFSLKNGKLELVPYPQDDESSGNILVSMNWPTVNGIKDGEPMIAETFNRPLKELAERTTYLYDKLRTFNRNEPLGTVILSEAALASDNTPDVGDVVYLDAENMVYRKAVATLDLFDDFSAADSAYAAGVVIKRGGSSANVVLFGRLDMTLSGMNINKMLEEGEKFRPGIYYLSSDEPGKLTAYPKGPRVVIGKFTGGQFSLVNINARDLGESHVHRSYSIKGLPAGDQLLTADDPTGKHVYLGYSPEHFASFGEKEDTDIYPGLMFTGEWLGDHDTVYNFTLQGLEDGSVPAQKFGQNPGVFLKWETAGRSGTIRFNSFDTPKEIENGVYVSLTCGDPSAYVEGGTTEGKYVYRVAVDTEAKRQWNGFNFPECGRGWRKLTDSEKDRYTTIHGSASAVPAFIYNIGFDKAMQAYFPPVPAKSASLTVNGVEVASDKFKDASFVYSIGQDSLYWFDDSWDHAPWPTEYFTRHSEPGTWEEKKMVLHFIRTATSDTGPVMSLIGAPGSGVKVVSCASGEAASVGDLMIDIDPLGDVVEDDLTGYKVVKAGGNGVFKTGPVVERIVQGTGIVLTKLGNAPLGQGTVVISAANSGIQGDFEEVALQNAKQDMVGMFPYIRLLGWSSSQANTPSAFILKFHVPYDNPDALYAVHMYANVFGTQSYTDTSVRYAGIRMDYSILPDLNPVNEDGSWTASANVQDDLISPDSSRVVEIPIVSDVSTSATVYKAFDPVYIYTENGEPDVAGKKYSAFREPIPFKDECTDYMSKHLLTTIGVRPGYTVAVKLARGPVVSGVQDYAAPIGFMNMRWSIERAE